MPSTLRGNVTIVRMADHVKGFGVSLPEVITSSTYGSCRCAGSEHAVADDTYEPASSTRKLGLNAQSLKIDNERSPFPQHGHRRFFRACGEDDDHLSEMLGLLVQQSVR